MDGDASTPQRKWFQGLAASGRTPGRVVVMTPESQTPTTAAGSGVVKLPATIPRPTHGTGSAMQQQLWISSMAANTTTDGQDLMLENRFPSADNLSSSGVAPMPPSVPKRSQTITKGDDFEHNHMNNTGGASIKGGRASLASTLASMVGEGLRNLPPNRNDIQSKMLRLDVYRNAFQHLIDEFNVYRPFLSALKSEYDSVLHSFSDDVRCVESLRMEAVLKEKELTAKLNQAERKCTIEIAKRDTEITRLNGIIQDNAADRDSLRDRFDAIQQRCATAEKDLTDMRASCLNLTNSLARVEDERRIIQANEHNKAVEIQAMKTALLRSSEEVTALRTMMNDLESVHATLVGPEVVSAHLSTIESLKAEVASQDKRHRDLLNRYTVLKMALEATSAVRPARTAAAGETKSGDGSPLDFHVPIDSSDPEQANEWNEVMELIRTAHESGGSRKIIEDLISEVLYLRKHGRGGAGGKGRPRGPGDEGGEAALTGIQAYRATALVQQPIGANNATDDVNRFATTVGLVSDVADAGGQSPWTHFDGLGMDAKLPKYFRAVGKIQNLFLSKGETEQFINDVWSSKAEWEKNAVAGTGNTVAKIHLSAFFEIFLEHRFKSPTRAVEFAYNIIDAATKYSFDIDCKLFVMIMQGEISEDLRHDQLHTIEALVREMRHEDSSLHGTAVGHVPAVAFMRVVKRLFPTKGELSLSRLERALEIETRGARAVHYEALLGESEDGDQGKFTETLRMQHLLECVTFAKRVNEVIVQFHDDLISLASETGSAADLELLRCGGRSLSVNQLRSALLQADPDKPRAEVNRYLARGCNCSVQEVLLMEAQRNIYYPVNKFLANLKRGLIKKSNPSFMQIKEKLLAHH